MYQGCEPSHRARVAAGDPAHGLKEATRGGIVRPMRFIHCIVALLAGLVIGGCARSEPLLLCGMEEVFEIDAAALGVDGAAEKRWSWRAADRPELPAELRGRFKTTDDCKPIDGGKRVLISSSGGGCALVERPSGRVVWHAFVGNAHSLEMLPGGRIVVAGSVHPQGNKLALFAVDRPGEPVWEAELYSGHGVVWDAARERLWALGGRELRSYSLAEWATNRPVLKLEATHALPDEGGHDLQPVGQSADLVVSTSDHVYLFDRDRGTFRLHPQLGDKAAVKCVSIHPRTGRTVYIQGGGGNWWSPVLRFLDPAGEATLGGERLYKGRWVVEGE